MTNQLLTTAFISQKKCINNGLSSSQKVFGCLTYSYEVVLSLTNKVIMMAFIHQKKVLTTALDRHKRYLVVQLPCMKLTLQWQLSSSYDGVVLSQISVSDSVIGNIVFPTRLLPTNVNGIFSVGNTNLRRLSVLLRRNLAVANSNLFCSAPPWLCP